MSDAFEALGQRAEEVEDILRLHETEATIDNLEQTLTALRGQVGRLGVRTIPAPEGYAFRLHPSEGRYGVECISFATAEDARIYGNHDSWYVAQQKQLEERSPSYFKTPDGTEHFVGSALKRVRRGHHNDGTYVYGFETDDLPLYRALMTSSLTLDLVGIDPAQEYPDGIEVFDVSGATEVIRESLAS